MSQNPTSLEKTEGVLLGIAVADALGLPMECMKPTTIANLGWARHPKQRLIGNLGMWSDDTEHSIMLAQALLKSQGNVHQLKQAFANELRAWFLSFPAGVGMATARSCIKLLMGYPLNKSGVFSAGNGPAMRAHVIAALPNIDETTRYQLTKAHTQLTHSDPKAVIAAFVICEITHWCLSNQQNMSLDDLEGLLQSNQEYQCQEWKKITERLLQGIQQNHSAQDFMLAIGINPEKGVSGYIYHTVPVAIFVGFQHQWSYQKAIPEVIALGGDTDTSAAILGGICGAKEGSKAIPADWIHHIAEWPCSVRHLPMLARALHDKVPNFTIRTKWSPFLIARNLYFFCIVLSHGFLRILCFKYLKRS